MDLKTLILIGPLPISNFPSKRGQEFGILFLDGGKNHLKKIPESYCKAPSLSLGDGDSLEKGVLDPLDFHFSPDKDFSDLSLALQSIPRSITYILGLGLMGGDLSHQLANIGEIHQLLIRHESPLLMELQGESQRLLATNRREVDFEIHGRFSLFSLAEIDFQIKGECRYNCSENMNFKPLSSHGLSNIGSGKVSIKASQPYFLIIDE